MDKNLTTLFTGRKRISLRETESTNQYLSALAQAEKIPEGTAVVADFQTAGQGLAGTKWHSEPGANLLMSLFFLPDFLPVKKIYLISKAVALGIKDFLDEQGIQAKIKWPNDTYVGESKISGVLIENSIRGMQIQQSIVGIGLNVNQLVFPKEVPNPVSMHSITGHTYSIEVCFTNLCRHLEKRYLQLKNEDFNLINNDYLKSLFRFYEMELYESAAGKFYAQIIDVEDEGKLVLKRSDGGLQRFGFKEIKFL